ncbi:hypothetical protein [Actinomadura sp. 21ATH]|uniref:hypothetical protein n=1 Tax=Actinomadura sp. 21ATH TaxID=1735444 RepID=UPI0035BF58F4
MTDALTVPDRARALFASRLQESGRPTSQQVRAVVEAALAAGAGDCLALVAQEAGDHPEIYLPRMRWALSAVHEAYAGEPAGGADLALA